MVAVLNNKCFENLKQVLFLYKIWQMFVGGGFSYEQEKNCYCCLYCHYVSCHFFGLSIVFSIANIIFYPRAKMPQMKSIMFSMQLTANLEFYDIRIKYYRYEMFLFFRSIFLLCTRKRLALVYVIYMYLVESRKKPVYQWFSPFFERQKNKKS